MFHLLFYLVWITCILTALNPTVIVSNLRINPVKTLHEFTHYTRLWTIQTYTRRSSTAKLGELLNSILWPALKRKLGEVSSDGYSGSCRWVRPHDRESFWLSRYNKCSWDKKLPYCDQVVQTITNTNIYTYCKMQPMAQLWSILANSWTTNKHLCNQRPTQT